MCMVPKSDSNRGSISALEKQFLYYKNCPSKGTLPLISVEKKLYSIEREGSIVSEPGKFEWMKNMGLF